MEAGTCWAITRYRSTNAGHLSKNYQEEFAMTHDISADLEARLWTELAPSSFAFIGLLNDEESDVPMTLHVDGNNRHSLWIFTTLDNRLNRQGAAMARYICKHQDLFARIKGVISSETDQSVIDRLWTRQVAAWYEGGRDDPNLVVLRLDVERSEIWLADMSPLTMIKMLVGAKIRDHDVQGKHATILTS